MLPAGNVSVMHLILRTLLQLFLSRRRPTLSIWDSGSVAMRVLVTDIDIALHMNNGMYFSVFDLGRFDLLVRSGAWRQMRRRKWSPVAAGETITFRKSLQLGQRYTIESRIIGLDERAIYFEQRAVAGGEIFARAFIATRLVSPSGPVSNEEVIRTFGTPPDGMVLPEWVHQWRIDTALPSTRRPAPHSW
jgi:acyl-CoA thioesterase FadM